MPSLAAAIARFHLAADRRTDHGGSAGMGWVIEGNAAGFAEFGADFLEPSACVRLTDDASTELHRRGALLDARRAAGFVRQCHGDLHLRNIVMLEGQPTLFDAVEFNDEIACIDILYDLAFLLMDLWRRHLPRHANAVWNGYLAETADLDGVSLLPLFLSCRAAVRAKTSATAAGVQGDPERASELRTLAQEYLALAERLLHPAEPCVIVERVAASASVPFVGLWLDAPAPVLLDRTHRRVADASDATADIVRLQLAQEAGVIGWRRIDASAPAEVVLQQAMTCLPARSTVDG